MRRKVTTVTVRDVTVLLVRMSAGQVAEWKWIGGMRAGEDPVDGYEVRDTTGALLGLLLPLGHLATRMHVECYDPAEGDFFSADLTKAVLTHGVARVLEQREQHIGAVPAGMGFDLDEARYRWIRPERCPKCASRERCRETECLVYY